MADITININTGSKNSEPKVTTTTDNTSTAIPKPASPKVETPHAVMTKETTSEKETPKEDDAKKMPALSPDRDMTEAEHAKMSADKTDPSEEAAPKQKEPKEEMKEENSPGKDDAKEMDMTEAEHAKMDSDK